MFQDILTNANEYKCIFFRFEQPHTSKVTDETYDGWAYVGSHNLSESAWGNPTLERGKDTPKIFCRNWECGVVLPLKSKRGIEERGAVPMTAFEGRIPVPMRTPAQRNARPWFFMNN